MFIKSKISRQQAENIFTHKKTSSPLLTKLLFWKTLIPPERLEILHLPFYLFDVLVEREKKGEKDTRTNRQQVMLSVDGLLGHAVLYAENALDADENPRTPVLDFTISSADAAKMALDQYKGILLEHGLRTRSHPRAEEISGSKRVYYPFWVAYYKKKKGYDFNALDAVSGEIQGIKMRRIFIKALKKLGSKD